ncbi:MAG: tetratricopeptide repeat protein [bacterium]
MTQYLIIAALVVGIALGTFIALKTRRRKKTRTTSYIDALHLLLENKKDEALAQLKKTVREDTENIMAYITLGDLFRDKELPVRAAKVHRNLLVRGDLNDSEISTILRSLVLDYKAAGQLGKAVEMAERLVHRSRKNVKDQQLLLALCEEKGDWDKAFFFRQSINKWLKKDDQSILAMYKVQSGLSFTKQGAEREGRIRFREAIKLYKKCVPAFLYWGDSYRREQRNEDAFRIYRDFTQKIPEWAHLCFDRMKEVLFDLGRYGEIESIYEQVIQSKSQDPTATINLAELYRKQGNLDKASDTCRNILEIHPQSQRARLLLVQLLKQKGDEKKALGEAMEGLKQTAEEKTVYDCSECRFESEEPLWRCPQCGGWNTFLIEKKS